MCLILKVGFWFFTRNIHQPDSRVGKNTQDGRDLLCKKYRYGFRSGAQTPRKRHWRNGKIYYGLFIPRELTDTQHCS